MNISLKQWGIYSLLALVVVIQGCKSKGGGGGDCPWIVAPLCVYAGVVGGTVSGSSRSAAAATAPNTEAPGTPTHLRSEYSVASGEMSISWQQAADNTLVYDYRIYRDGVYLQTTPAASFVDLNLNPDTLYCYQVSVTDYSENESQKSINSCSSTAYSAQVVQLPQVGDSLIQPTSLALDSNGNAHMSYFVAENRDVYYATNSPGEWSLTKIDTGAEGVPALSLDASGKAHLFYRDGGIEALRYASNVSGTWLIAEVDTARVGGNPSSGIDSAGTAHISYYDDANHSLTYASNLSGQWSQQLIDAGYNTGRYSSLAVDAMDRVHISYWDEINGELKYATNATGPWVLRTVDSAGVAGSFPSLVIDPFGMIHISYYDETIRGLRYASNQTGEWIKSTIDDSDSTVWNPTIAVDSQGHAHVTYYDSEYGNLRYATNLTGAWQAHEIASYSSGGSSIKLDYLDRAHISFQEQMNIYYSIYSSD